VDLAESADGNLGAWRKAIDTVAALELGPPKQRVTLALLLAQAAHPVGIHQLADALWPEDPPDSARNVVHRHIGSLRRLLEAGSPPEPMHNGWFARPNPSSK
jgi:DNA-binding SARP family transcriptional activator